ncbi:MAG: hypothetical protein AAGI38_19520 [Bacteroidota bacterium]
MKSPEERTEYYRFIVNNVLRALLWFGLIVGGYFVFNEFFGEKWRVWISPLTDRPSLLMLIFLLSETFFGIIPPEFFVIWASDKPTDRFIFYVILLASLSILGGLIAFGAGKLVTRIKWLKRLTELESFQEYANLYRRYGGILIVISALTPLPYATISLLSASLGFPLNRYLLYASSRILRFVLLAWFFGEVSI